MLNNSKIINQKNDSCWLKYKKLSKLKITEFHLQILSNILVIGNSEILNTAVNELKHGLSQILDLNPIKLKDNTNFFTTNCLFLAKINCSEEMNSFINDDEIFNLNDESFIIRKMSTVQSNKILITAKTDIGILYGVFNFLKKLILIDSIDKIDEISTPKNKHRFLNHWDNIDGTIERGYAGNSIFFANNEILDITERTINYARLLASIGINGIVINNVNVKDNGLLITRSYLPKVSKIADLFRNYGIKLYLSINFASPMEIGKLKSANPTEPCVYAWWKAKINEIYHHISDFGGFLIKADSEFRPGPHTYGIDHAVGANMFAEILQPYSGIVIWRCFVYNCRQDWRDTKTDRAKAAYENFKSLDGKFLDNVILQIKNGPMDFQVREPVSPLFGALKNTNQILELQITQEYTGQQKHICYLVPQWKEILEFKTWVKDQHSKVKDIISGTTFKKYNNGIAAVANIGNQNNWTGHTFAQANLYGYGRLAWDPDLETEQITQEWIKLTFSTNKYLVNTILDIISNSWQIYEKYTTPLGIGWMVNPEHHFGPNVDGYEYSHWGTYHRADSKGLGIDRTSKNGTAYTLQYHEKITKIYDSLETCPEELLLFFHHVPYTHKLKSGVSVIQYFYDSHFAGVEDVQTMYEKWLSLKNLLETDIFNEIAIKLKKQIEYAKEWRDVVNSYFYRKSGIPDKLGRKIF